MSRPKHLAGYIKKIGDPVTITPEQWRSTINAYGQDLPVTVQKLISARTSLFSAVMQGEQNTITSRELLQELRKIHKSAWSVKTKVLGTIAPERSLGKRASLQERLNAVLKFYESQLRENYGDFFIS